MSFGGFGSNSGPGGPSKAQPTFGHFSQPSSPPVSAPPFPGSAAPPRSPNPRTFGTFQGARSPLPFDNASLATGTPRPSVPSIRGATPLQRGNRQSSAAGHVVHPIQKRSPPSGPHDLVGRISSKASQFPGVERTRSPPLQYTEDFLNPGNDGKERAAPLQWANRQSSPAGHVVHPIQKRSPPSGPRDLGASISSKASQFTGVERMRSPPVQYNEDFLNPDIDGKERAAPLRWSDRQSSRAGGGNGGGSTQKRSPLSGPRDLGTDVSSKAYRLQNLERTQSPLARYTEDFLNPNKDGEERDSLFPPTSMSRRGVLGMPKLQHNQRSSPPADAMNSGAHAKAQASHSVSKRTRSPPAAVTGQISLRNSYSEDDSERELQAKARRLARFKTELDEVEPSDTNQYGSNAAGKKVSSVKTHQPSKEKKNFPGDDSSRSMEQDFDNEDLQTSGVIVGLCPDMCPESERAERERKGDLDRYERLDGDRNQTSRTLAVKKYNRTAEREAELIRPMPILQKTMDYLLGLLEQPYDDRFLGLYNFLWDRMRAIRMDLRMQHIFNLEAITMLEQMIRLHIIVMHELCEFSKGEGFSEGFDAHLNIEQMNKTSVELFQLYDDHRKRGILVPTEKEFRGYYALLKLDKHPGYKVEPAELSLDLAKMTAEIRQTHEVRFARNVARSCRTSNFIAFFRHARKGSYHQACLMHAHFSKLRTQALASLHSGLLNNQGLPVSHVASWLGMEGEDIESLLEYHGFSIREYEEPYMVKEGPFLNADKDYPTRRSELVHGKRSNTILEDILSSHQETSSQAEFKREIRLDKNMKSKPAVPQHKRPPEPLITSDEVMDMEAVPSPKDTIRVEPVLATSRSMQVQPLFGSPRGGQPSSEDRPRTSVSSPKGHIPAPNVFPSFPSPRIQEQPSPVPRNGSSLNLDTSPLPGNFSIPQSVPDAQLPLFGWARETSQDGFVRSPRGDGKWIRPTSEVDSGDVSLQKDGRIVVEEARKELTDGHHEVENDDDANRYSEEVSKAKLKLLIRLWKRHSARRRAYRELNRSAAIAALSTLSLGPPIRHIKDKHMPCRKLNIDQAVNERHEKLQQSWARWNVSEVVAGKLGKKNANSNCICWKVVSFSWLHRSIGDIEARSPINHLSLDQWLQYKLIPAHEDDTVNDLVMSAPGLSIWSKWVPDRADAITCCLSVIKGAESGNFEKKLAGASAILFPVSESVPWELQRVELHNLVMPLPAGSRIPLLVLSGSNVDNIGEFPQSMAEKLGLNDIDKSRVGSISVICLSEREGTDQYYGYLSDQKLKEGLMWLASESHPQPVLYDVTLRELVSSHLNLCLDSFGNMGSDKLSPNQCISAFNEALDRSINNIIAAANMNPTGWPCPEVFLLDDSAAEFRAVRQFLPSLGWSSQEEVEPLISALRSSKLPSFSDDTSLLNRGCTDIQDFESQRRLLQDSLVKYLSQSSNVMNWMMATKEADVMLEKCTRLELHDTQYRLVPDWQLIFRRVVNWQLSKLAGIARRAYVLEQPRATSNPTFFEKSDFEVSASRFIVQPSLNEMVEVSCSPIVSKRVKSSPKSFHNVSSLASAARAVGLAMFGHSEEGNRCSPIQVQNQFSPVQVQPINFSESYMDGVDSEMVPKVDKEPDRLSKLLEQCNALQDEIEKKLSIYF